MPSVIYRSKKKPVCLSVGLIVRVFILDFFWEKNRVGARSFSWLSVGMSNLAQW